QPRCDLFSLVIHGKAPVTASRTDYDCHVTRLFFGRVIESYHRDELTRGIRSSGPKRFFSDLAAGKLCPGKDHQDKNVPSHRHEFKKYFPKIHLFYVVIKINSLVHGFLAIPDWDRLPVIAARCRGLL